LPGPAAARSATAPVAPPAVTNERRVVLGRIVDLATMQPGAIVTDGAPDQELSDPDSDLAVVLQYDGRLRGFRLSTGAQVWSVSPYAPCRTVVLGGPHVYAACGDKLLSYGKADGSFSELKQAGASEVVVAGALLASLDHRTGHASLFETATNRLIADKRLPEIERPWHFGLVPVSSVDGVCSYGVHMDAAVPNGWACRVGCYDRRLSLLWGNSVSFTLPADPDALDSLGTSELIRQTGPSHLVLASVPASNSKHKGRSPGAVVRWRDGRVTYTDDGTFATVEDAHGERFTTAEVLRMFTDLPGPANDKLDWDFRDANIVGDGERTFALIVQKGRTALAALEVATGRVLFRVHVPLGYRGWKLELAGGLPIVRTDLGKSWRATVHDPGTGRVLYRDERPYH
jgi:hypothetical protein